ncbi:MAG: hypothetical protein KBD21_05375 [Candidatus Pacebacteria bacterium]|nr:hypothetical protein [Candidatus Paceibacterota bacterium]
MSFIHARIHTVKVIKPGNPHKAWTRELTRIGAGKGVDGCGAVLEVAFADIYKTENKFFSRLAVGSDGVAS